MSSGKAPNELTASEAADAIAGGGLTSEALVAACLERIEAREATVEAWVHIDADGALATARRCDREAPRGPLHGVPVGFKDVIDTAGMPTEYNSPIYAGHRPVADAACVAGVRAAGGIVLGKTVTTEFAAFTPGKTKNPHNPAHSPGGSSSGSAAAVADFMAPLSFGTQTGGSTIRPGSFCGIVGYKPTHDDISFIGTKPLSPSCDTLGLYGRSVADVTRLRSALAGGPVAPAELDRAPRIGLCRTLQWDEAEASSQQAVLTSAENLTAAGAAVTDVDLPADFASLPAINHAFMAFEGYRSFAYEFAHHEDKLSPKFRDGISPGRDMAYADYADGRAHVAHCRGLLSGIFDGYDVLLVPAVTGEAPRGLETTGNSLFNRTWTILGTPAITLPGHTGPLGLPVGVQAVARRGDDARLLAVAQWMATRIL